MDVSALSNTVLRDADGVERLLGDYWARQPIVLVFLRHFG